MRGSRRPHHALVAADFSRLPPAGGVVGEMAPVVASKSDGVNTDHSTYLVEPGTADIFFPTDFHLLKKMWLESALEDAVAQELKEKVRGERHFARASAPSARARSLDARA